MLATSIPVIDLYQKKKKSCKTLLNLIPDAKALNVS